MTRVLSHECVACATEEGSDAVRYTDIVKARALRRAGRACEMCGASVGFESAQFVSAHPIFGVLFDQDDCCVLCDECLSELDPSTRAAAEGDPSDRVSGLAAHADRLSREPGETKNEEAPSELIRPELHEAPGAPTSQQDAQETWFPRRDPDGGMCA